MILYCNFGFPLKEDGKLDKYYRKLANDIILQIQAFIRDNMSREEIFDLAIRSHQGIPIISCTEKMSYLQNAFDNVDGILFAKIKTDNFGLIHFGIDLAGRLNYEGVSNSKQKLLIIKGISSDQILRMCDVLFLFIKGQTFLHELIHCLDYKRINKNIKTIKYDPANEEDYFNSPKEFNAWFQEIFYDIEENILRRMESQKITLPWVYDFFNNTYLKLPGPKVKAYKNFINKLNKKNKARFFLRLYNNFKDVWFKEENK